MIKQLSGTLIEKTPSEIVVDCHGVGYAAMISMATFGQLPEIDSRVRLYTVLIPREDALQLFGFFQQATAENNEILFVVTKLLQKYIWDCKLRKTLPVLRDIQLIVLYEFVI